MCSSTSTCKLTAVRTMYNATGMDLIIPTFSYLMRIIQLFLELYQLFGILTFYTHVHFWYTVRGTKISGTNFTYVKHVYFVPLIVYGTIGS